MPEQVADLDRQKAEEAALRARIAGLHVRLFPEEYGHENDFYYDSSLEAKLRARGQNPKSEYIGRNDTRRQALGFAPCSGGPSDLPRDTIAWVGQMIRDGREDELLALADRHEAEDEERSASGAPPSLHDVPAEELATELDAYLQQKRASRIVLRPEQEQQALEIYGFFLRKNAMGFGELVLKELRRLHPGENEDVLRERIAFAKEWWEEAYGC